MSAHMKTLKCMYVLKSGPNPRHSCMYFMQARETSCNHNMKQVEEYIVEGTMVILVKVVCSLITYALHLNKMGRI